MVLFIIDFVIFYLYNISRKTWFVLRRKRLWEWLHTRFLMRLPPITCTRLMFTCLFSGNFEIGRCLSYSDRFTLLFFLSFYRYNPFISLSAFIGIVCVQLSLRIRRMYCESAVGYMWSAALRFRANFFVTLDGNNNAGLLAVVSFACRLSFLGWCLPMASSLLVVAFFWIIIIILRSSEGAFSVSSRFFFVGCRNVKSKSYEL